MSRYFPRLFAPVLAASCDPSIVDLFLASPRRSRSTDERASATSQMLPSARAKRNAFTSDSHGRHCARNHVGGRHFRRHNGDAPRVRAPLLAFAGPLGDFWIAPYVAPQSITWSIEAPLMGPGVRSPRPAS